MAPHPKHCPRCCQPGEFLPADAFNWPKSRPEGAGWCRNCALQAKRDAYNPATARRRRNQTPAQRSDAQTEAAYLQARVRWLDATKARITRERQADADAAAMRRGILAAGHGIPTIELVCCVPEYSEPPTHSRNCPITPRRPVYRQQESPAAS
jgi:hypothetical protein